ncbi:MAG: CE1 family esterase [Planctomycetota bacterium]
MYATGFSNGATFCQYLAANQTAVFAAIAPCAGGLPADGYPNDLHVAMPVPTTSVPVLIVNGLADTARLYDGGLSQHGRYQFPAEHQAIYWSTVNGCDSTPTSRTSRLREVDRYEDCAGDAEVIFVTVKKMPHKWPDRADDVGFDMNRTVFEFFDRHAR